LFLAATFAALTAGCFGAEDIGDSAINLGADDAPATKGDEDPGIPGDPGDPGTPGTSCWDQVKEICALNMIPPDQCAVLAEQKRGTDPGGPCDPGGPKDPGDPSNPGGPKDPGDPSNPGGPKDPGSPKDP
jgi:hypothetical protein